MALGVASRKGSTVRDLVGVAYRDELFVRAFGQFIQLLGCPDGAAYTSKRNSFDRLDEKNIGMYFIFNWGK